MRVGRRGRVLVAVAVIVIVITVAGVLGAAWFISDQFVAVSHPAPSYPERVRAVRTSGGVTTVSLAPSPAAASPGRYGLSWDGGSAMLGPPELGAAPDRIDRVLL